VQQRPTPPRALQNPAIPSPAHSQRADSLGEGLTGLTGGHSSASGSPAFCSPPPTNQGDYRKKPWMQTTSGLLDLHRDSAKARIAEFPSLLTLANSEQLTEDLKNMIHAAVVKMHGDLKDELNEEDITIKGVLGQGAFGTVYHGARRAPACNLDPRRCSASPALHWQVSLAAPW
jgi:hypothetical protein